MLKTLSTNANGFSDYLTLEGTNDILYYSKSLMYILQIDGFICSSFKNLETLFKRIYQTAIDSEIDHIIYSGKIDDESYHALISLGFCDITQFDIYNKYLKYTIQKEETT